MSARLALDPHQSNKLAVIWLCALMVQWCAGSSLPSLLGSAGGPDPLDEERVSWEQLLRQYVLDVRCDGQTITVLVHYDPTYNKMMPAAAAVIESSSVYLGEFNSSQQAPSHCRANKHTDQGSLMVQTRLDTCDIHLETGAPGTLIYRGQVTVQPHLSTDSANPPLMRDSVTLSVKCVQPVVSQQRNVKPQFSLLVYKESSPEVPLHKRQQDVGLDESLWVDARAQSTWYPHHHHISAFLSECWLSKSADDPVGRDARRFFKSGCLNHRGVLKVFSRADDHFKILFPLSEDLFELEQRSRDTAEIVYVHCRMLACHNNTDTAIYGIPKCPMAGYCGGVPSVTHRLPDYLKPYDQWHSVSDAIIVNKRNSAQHSVVSLPDDCRIKCGLALSEHTNKRNANDQSPSSDYLAIQRVHTDGLSVTTTVLVAVSSFLLGTLLMAAVWFVHVQTDARAALHKRAQTTTANGALLHGHVGQQASTSSSSSQSLPLAPVPSAPAHPYSTTVADHLAARNNRNPHALHCNGVRTAAYTVGRNSRTAASAEDPTTLLPQASTVSLRNST